MNRKIQLKELIIACLAMACISADAKPPEKSENAMVFPSFGVALSPPSTWVRANNGPALSSTVVDFVPSSATNPGAELISVEMGDKAGSVETPTIEKWAEKMSKLRAMRVSKDTVEVGGKPARELTGVASTNGHPELVRCRVTEHAGYYLCIWQVSPEPRPDRAAFDEICKHISWSKPIAPAEALASDARYAPIQSAGLEFSLPDPFRLFETVKDGAILHFNTFDFRDDKTECRVVVTAIDAKKLSTVDIEDLLSQNASRAAGHRLNLDWSARAGSGCEVAFTKPYDSGNDEQVPTNFQAVIARGSTGKTLVLTFQFPKAAAAAYAKCITEHIVPSVRDLKPAPTVP